MEIIGLLCPAIVSVLLRGAEKDAYSAVYSEFIVLLWNLCDGQCFFNNGCYYLWAGIVRGNVGGFRQFLLFY